MRREYLMLRKRIVALFVLPALIMLSGCAVVGIGAAVASGTYLYVNGEMKTDYYASFDRVWVAVEKTIADMHGLDVVRTKEIAQGTISTVINEDKVYFSVKYKDKDATVVSIRVGVLGNKLASQLLHDKIAENLAKKP
jgi:hypothetical protein